MDVENVWSSTPKDHFPSSVELYISECTAGFWLKLLFFIKATIFCKLFEIHVQRQGPYKADQVCFCF